MNRSRKCIVWHSAMGIVALLLATASPLAAQNVEAQAIAARPFGVAAVSFTVSAAPASEMAELYIEEKNGRIFYPVFASGLIARVLGTSNEAAAGSGRTALFLFTDSNPLQLTIHTPNPVTVEVRPTGEARRNLDRLFARWWREYYSASAELSRRGDYPPVLEAYLTGMLGQRFGQRPPLLNRIQQKVKSPLGKTIDLLFGTEDLYVETVRNTMSGPRAPAVANLPIPEDIAWTPLQLAPGNEVEIEPIAKHVPAECFYVRFGSFENFNWLEELMTSYGGDVQRMIAARGQDAKASDRIRQQLSLPNSALAKIFGGQLIADVALIGRDIYLQDGVAVGVLLQARNSAALSLILQQHRRSIAAAEEAMGTSLETVSIGDREVTFLSSPDNRLRSYHAADGDFHLVTTSRRIMERFLEAGRGVGSLADSGEFQLARAQMPLSRKDTIFAFLSTSFFGGLMGPHYQIELQRRVQALSDLQLIQLAKLAATNEGLASDSLDDLIAGGFLPTGFGRGADGSGPIIEANRVIDSLRGARGTFTPIPDVPLEAATAAEVAAYSERARYFAEQWRQLDPLMVAVQRSAMPGEAIERITIDANISPIAEQKYGWLLSMLGPPVTRRIAPRVGDVVSVQAYVTGGGAAPAVPPHLLFLGIQDVTPVLQGGTSGIWETLRLLRTTPGYLGAWPKPGFLDMLPIKFPPAPDGYSRLPFDLWRWQGDAFSVLSFHRDVLDMATPQLRIEDTDQPAQIRVNVGDLSSSRLRDWVNRLYFQRARETSVANVQFLHALTQQLDVEPATALQFAERLLDTHFVCPLGGKYELAQTPSGRNVWRSTAWTTVTADNAAQSFTAPLLQWLRGVELSLTRSGDQVQLHGEVLMKKGK